jgi:hypothetical protein
MKKYLILITSITISLLCITSNSYAINKEWSAVAGFVGGVLFHSAISDASSHSTRVTYNHHSYEPPRSHVYTSVHYHQHGGYRQPEPRGHWETVSDRRWISGSWYYEYDHCGRTIKHWREGYWDYYNRRVWVSYK